MPDRAELRKDLKEFLDQLEGMRKEQEEAKAKIIERARHLIPVLYDANRPAAAKSLEELYFLIDAAEETIKKEITSKEGKAKVHELMYKLISGE